MNIAQQEPFRRNSTACLYTRTDRHDLANTNSSCAQFYIAKHTDLLQLLALHQYTPTSRFNFQQTIELQTLMITSCLCRGLARAHLPSLMVHWDLQPHCRQAASSARQQEDSVQIQAPDSHIMATNFWTISSWWVKRKFGKTQSVEHSTLETMFAISSNGAKNLALTSQFCLRAMTSFYMVGNFTLFCCYIIGDTSLELWFSSFFTPSLDILTANFT